MTGDGKILGRAKASSLPGWITAAVALLLWRLFFPGLMSIDSIIQYGQALTGQYNDWQPPLMAIVLHAVFSLGGAIGLLMLGQCVAGVFGVVALARAVVALLYGDLVPERRAAWLPLLVLLALLVPVTPLAFYLMTFWKDVWAMILMLWIAALSLDLFRRGPAPKRLLLLIGLIGLGAALGLVRHNAVVVLPIVGLAIWEGTRRIYQAKALALAAAPLALYLVAGPLIDRVFAVQKLHPDSQVMALDLVGICAADRAACARLPWTQAHVLDPDALAAYRPGDIGFIFWDQPPHVDPSIRSDYPRLRTEYLRAVREFPGTLLRVKLEAFETLLGLDQTYYFFHDSIADNPYRLALGQRLAPLRQRLSATAKEVAGNRVLRWISGVHLVWLAVDVLAVAGLLAASFRSGGARCRILAWVLLIPLGYYLSYLFAAPVHDFRFMFPATLTVQCIALSGLLGALSAHGRRSSTT
ncbi:MAG: hypothetical protein QOF89_5204 [Acidobacteriota bacterium]|jgi:hypothetical protein|nr:hypothetical protein [Acidobacteriota bacterium]